MAKDNGVSLALAQGLSENECSIGIVGKQAPKALEITKSDRTLRSMMGSRLKALLELVSNGRKSIQVAVVGDVAPGVESGTLPLGLDPLGKMGFVSSGTWDFSGPSGPSLAGAKGERKKDADNTNLGEVLDKRIRRILLVIIQETLMFLGGWGDLWSMTS